MKDPKKVAIIEDEVMIRKMYAMKLQFAHFTVIEAEDGIEGLEVVERERPDIILLDLMMPRMKGDEMLRELRAQSWGEKIPVVILTNISKDEAPRTLWHLGISDFVIKANTTPQKIVELIERILSEQE